MQAVPSAHQRSNRPVRSDARGLNLAVFAIVGIEASIIFFGENIQ